MSSDLGYTGFRKPDAYTPYAAGSKLYGLGQTQPTSGPITNKDGYIERDMQARARRNAILQRMSAEQRGRYLDPDYLRGV